MNDQYWQQYYKEHARKEPSNFAQFCLPRIAKGSTIVDVGAGDGRDTQLLKGAGYVLAIEPSAAWDQANIGPNVRLIKKDFQQYLKELQANAEETVKPTVVYARWFFHAVEEEIEDRVLDWCQANQAALMAEFRALGGVLPDDTHKRRLVDGNGFLQKLSVRGYRIAYYEEGYGFSKVGDDDPYLGRVIAKYGS